MFPAMSALHIGTCSWKYDSWIGLVYSPEVGRDYLREYARRYDTVEVDQWFWSLHGPDKISLPQPAAVREYAASVPPEFRFTIKVPNAVTLTHFYCKTREEPLRENPHFLSRPLFLDFLDSLGPLRPQVGAFIFQFEYLNRHKMPSQQEFLRRLAGFFEGLRPGIPCAVEVRNPNYLDRPYFEFLAERQLAPVFMEGYFMPGIVPIYGRYRDLVREMAVIRLHGPDRAGMETRSGKDWSRLLEPKDEGLDAISRMIKELYDRKVDLYLNVNNHYEGSAPLTIERIRQRLEKS